MSAELLEYLQVFGPGIIASVVAAIAIWILRGVLAAIGRAVLWIVRLVWSTIVNAAKWRAGWY